ncbi:hypothetical protein [Streptomyces sp. enrichment culture]
MAARSPGRPSAYSGTTSAAVPPWVTVPRARESPAAAAYALPAEE